MRTDKPRRLRGQRERGGSAQHINRLRSPEPSIAFPGAQDAQRNPPLMKLDEGRCRAVHAAGERRRSMWCFKISCTLLCR